MVNNRDEALDLIFHALADKTRRDILTRLAASGDLTISRLAETYDMSLVAVSKHVKVLEKAGLVVTNKQGRVFRCVMRFEPLQEASEQIAFYMRYWTSQMDELDKYVQNMLGEREGKSNE